MQIAAGIGLVVVATGFYLRPEVAMTDHAEDQAQRIQTPTLTRVIVGGDGRTWLVRQTPPSPYDRRGAPTLVFLTDDVMRRVRDYPPNWFELPDAELFALSMSR